MMQLHREGKIILLQNNIPLESDEIPNDTLSIQAKTKTS
jgi:hypothetical protein